MRQRESVVFPRSTPHPVNPRVLRYTLICAHAGSIADIKVDHTARSGDTHTRRRYASVESWIGKEAGGYGSQMECRFPNTYNTSAEAGAEKSFGLIWQSKVNTCSCDIRCIALPRNSRVIVYNR
jgi:hypothetical protein